MVRSERVVAALTLLLLAPVWLFRFFPTQDGPSHLYNAFVLARLGDPSNTFLRAAFAVNLRPFPNWTMYLVMAPLTRVLPPAVVQQLMISLCIVAVSAAVLYLQKAFKGETDATAILGPILGYSYILFMGFFNFILGAALFVFAIGLWWRQRSLIAVYAVLALTYLSHGLAFAAALLALTTLAIVTRRWRALVSFAPAYVLLAFDALARTRGASEFRSVGWHMQHLIDLAPFDFFGTAHVWIARVILFLLCAAIVFTFTLRKLRPMIFVSGAFLLAYFVTPWGYGAGGWAQGGWVSERLLFLAVLTLPAWIEVPRRLISVALLVATFGLHFGVTSAEIAKLHHRIAALAAPSALIRPHSTLQSIGAPPELTRRVTPALHVVSYLALAPDVVDLDNYEARLADFPLVLRAGVLRRPPDYLVVWRSAHVRNVQNYRLLFTSPDLRLFGRAGP